MAFGLGHQPLAAKSAPAALVAPLGCSHSRATAMFRGSIRSRTLLDYSGPAARRRGRYARCQVLAFKGDAPLAKVDPSQRDMPACLPGSVRYRFVVPQYVTAFGQSLRVVGSLPELGDWNPEQAPTMCWSDGHQWSLECVLPQQSFEFKITVFEGQTVKWEGGSNRVVQADGGEDGGMPVEIVVWLTCNFDATSSTQLSLAVPRASIEDAYETGKATLEFLRLRKSKLGQDSGQESCPDEHRRQTAELARLSEAVVEQSTTVHQLGDLLGHDAGQSKAKGRWNAKPNVAPQQSDSVDVDNNLLLMAIDSVQVPKVLRRISFVQSWSASPVALLPGHGNGVGTSSAEAGSPLRPSPFLRGELDSRVEDLMSAAEVLLQEFKDSSGELEGADSASLEWASLAQEAQHVAVALEALGGGADAFHATQLQMRGLASVGSALAGCTGEDDVEDTGVNADAMVAAFGEVPAIEAFPIGSEASTGVLLEQHAQSQASAIALAPMTVEAASGDGSDRTAFDGTDTRLVSAAVMVASVGLGEEVAEHGSETNGASDVSLPEAWSPEAHPLQRLASSVKDTAGAPSSSQADYQRPGLLPTKLVAAPHSGVMIPLDDAARTAGRTGSGDPTARESELRPRELLSHEKRAGAAETFNIRAFLDSFFL